MLDRELVTRRIKAITDNAWRQDSGTTTTLNGMIEYIIREVTLDVLDPIFVELETSIKETDDLLHDVTVMMNAHILKEQRNGKDGQLQKPQRGAKASVKNGNVGTAEAR